MVENAGSNRLDAERLRMTLVKSSGGESLAWQYLLPLLNIYLSFNDSTFFNILLRIPRIIRNFNFI